MNTARSSSAAAMADYGPSNKRTKSTPSRKVCIICFCAFALEVEYNIFIVDLDSISDDNCVVLRRPTLRFEYQIFCDYAFCVVNSMLYLFKGYCPENNHEEKSVFTYDLSAVDDSTTSNLRLGKNDLKKAADMKHHKRCPLVTPTPDGKKILVFSSVLNYDDDAHNFELYDPSEDSWEKIPAIPHGSVSPFGATEFTFIDRSTFLLQTEIGMFALDLNFLDKGWERIDCYAGAVRLPSCGSVDPRIFVIDPELCLNAWSAFDIHQQNGLSESFYHPVSSFDDNYGLPNPRLITLLDGVDDGKCNYCIIQTALHKQNRLPHLIMDVCSFDLIKYKEEGVEPIKTKSFKFCLNDRQCMMLDAVNLFSF